MQLRIAKWYEGWRQLLNLSIYETCVKALCYHPIILHYIRCNNNTNGDDEQGLSKIVVVPYMQHFNRTRISKISQSRTQRQWVERRSKPIFRGEKRSPSKDTTRFTAYIEEEVNCRFLLSAFRNIRGESDWTGYFNWLGERFKSGASVKAAFRVSRWAPSLIRLAFAAHFVSASSM